MLTVIASTVAGLFVGGFGTVAVLRWVGPALRSGAGASAGAADGRQPCRSALEILDVGVLVLDADDQIVLANPAASELGILVATGGVRQLSTVVRTLAGQVRRTGVGQTMELDLPGARRGARVGAPSAVHMRMVPLDDRYIAIEVDDASEAHRVARIRRDFVANVSHELKTPVGALRLLAEALIEATDETTDQPADLVVVRRFAERIKHESTRLGRLVGDLIELTRLQGAEPMPEPEQVPLDNLLAEVIDRTRTPAAAKNIEVAVDGLRGLVLDGIESQLVTAIANLVENAVAYSPEGTGVTIATGLVGEMVQIDVSDQGIGIEPKDLGRIFERFYRADKARSRVTGGTGLGLAIVKHIATNHGGSVNVVSTVGTGSTFTLRLPACPQDVAAPPSPADEIGSATVDRGDRGVPA